MRGLLAAVVLAGCGAQTSAADAGPDSGVLCNDGYLTFICRCRSNSSTACGTFCVDATSAAIATCRADHGGLDGGPTCAESPVCL